MAVPTTNSYNKQRVDELSKAVHETTPDGVGDLVAEYYAEDAVWHGPAPIDRLEGRDALEAEFWGPLLQAFPDLEKNDYMLFGGEFEGEEWVCAAGNLVGTFDHEWLDIPPTGHATWLRYGAQHRMENGEISETRIIVDMLDLLRQAGFQFVPALAPEVVAPGPATRDGVLLDEQDAAGSETTLRLVEDMIFEGLDAFDGENLDVMRMEEYWHEDFMWYGPAGIGSTRGVDGFQDYHQRPWLTAFPDRGTGGDSVRTAEGNYCAWSAWPSGVATHAGDGLLGMPATDTSVAFRVLDFWRREGDLLAENWVYIDMVDLLDQLGVDVFERLRTHPESVRA
jgi:predicted ester cyclase